ncbi:MAG TPA: NUDIX domain-containing protein [Candidatus Limnocylindrales bacterium]|nr:NUDIX domain-containing protein [Candidatus Limnocylindrales bacterium]
MTGPGDAASPGRPSVGGAAASELVLAVARSRVPVEAWWRGVRADPPAVLLAALEAAAEFRPRGVLEDDPTWKQLIPYLVLRDGERIFLMWRTRAGADIRLHERGSIGVGGHVNPGDGGIAGGLRREWREEIAADFEPDFRLLGLLNDDEDPVGAVHLGVVYEADVAGRPVAVRETEKLRGGFVTLDEVAAERERLEGWSQLVLDALTVRQAAVRR